MGISIFLVDVSGSKVRGMPDPNGGRFDAAGDIDSLPRVPDKALTIWPDIDPYDDTVLGSEQMPELLKDIDRLYAHVRHENERRGLNRFKALAEQCAAEPSFTLLVEGD